MCRCGSSISVIANVQQIVGILDFYIKSDLRGIAKPNMELGSYAGELSVYLPLWLGNLPGASDYTAAVSADPWQRFPDPERKICITMSSNVCGNVPFAGAALTGAVIGACYARLDTRLSMLLSDGYFYFSGIHALMGAMQLTDPLAEIWTIFTVLVYLYESDFLMGLAAYVFYELLRVCFDRKL